MLRNYDRWLHREANSILGPTHPLHDDLVQEGRVAMWRSAVKHGEHAGFMTRSARLRMLSVASGEKAFGGIKVAVRDVTPVGSIDSLEPKQKDAIAPRVRDIAEQAALAYHHGELYRSISRLPSRQQEAVRTYLTGGVHTARERAAWGDAKKRLAQDLAHLKGVA
jgi:DNA-directed RNA polymerase specialized sigma24 family protein